MPEKVKLSRREREIMDVLYGAGEAVSAELVREQLSDPPSYSAVRAMLSKLEAKGQIKHRTEGMRYIYSPTGSRAVAKRTALKRLINVFFSGSPKQTATALLDDDSWTDEELDALSAQIEAVRKQRNDR